MTILKNFCDEKINKSDELSYPNSSQITPMETCDELLTSSTHLKQNIRFRISSFVLHMKPWFERTLF